MKRIFAGVGLLLFAGLTSGFAQTNAASSKQAAITFTADTYDFGAIPQGTPVSHVFSFKNTGKEPLILSSVTASCGCTTPEWPREPIKSGGIGNIKVTYNAATLNTFTKTITVVSNATPNQKVLVIKGDVKAQTTAATPAQQASPKKS